MASHVIAFSRLLSASSIPSRFNPALCVALSWQSMQLVSMKVRSWGGSDNAEAVMSDRMKAVAIFFTRAGSDLDGFQVAHSVVQTAVALARVSFEPRFNAGCRRSHACI